MSDDPKKEAADYRHKPSTEKILRQFLSLESCNANSKKFIEGYERTFESEAPVKLDPPVRCTQCEYEANTVEELVWHRRIGHVIKVGL